MSSSSVGWNRNPGGSSSSSCSRSNPDSNSIEIRSVSNRGSSIGEEFGGTGFPSLRAENDSDFGKKLEMVKFGGRRIEGREMGK